MQDTGETFPVVQRITDRLSRGATTRQPGCLERLSRLLTAARYQSGGQQVFVWGSCVHQRGATPIMPDITGLGSFAGTPMHSVDSVRTAFHHPPSTFHLRTTHER